MVDAHITAIGAALADPTRLRVIRFIEAERIATPGRVAEALQLARGSVHHHLKVCERAGIIRSARRGRCRLLRFCVGPWEGLLLLPGKPL